MSYKKDKKRAKKAYKAILETRDLQREQVEIESQMLTIALESMEMTRHIMLGMETDRVMEQSEGGE